MLSPVHAVPPFDSWTDILLDRIFIPVPQVTLQADHVFQFSHAQFTIKRKLYCIVLEAKQIFKSLFLYNRKFFGQPAGHVPQDNWLVSMLSPVQAVPPFASWVDILLTRVFIPVPQVMLQVDHEDQLSHAQFTKRQCFRKIIFYPVICYKRILDFIVSLFESTCRASSAIYLRCFSTITTTSGSTICFVNWYSSTSGFGSCATSNTTCWPGWPIIPCTINWKW